MSSVNHPNHYNQIPGIECIDVVENFDFNVGNAIKYLWRAGLKHDALEDLQKAAWYCNREIERITKETARQHSKDVANSITNSVANGIANGIVDNSVTVSDAIKNLDLNEPLLTGTLTKAE